MERTKLHDLLRELHHELDKADAIAGESRDLLQSVMDDIRGKLEAEGEAPTGGGGARGGGARGGGAQGNGAADDASLDDRLRGAAVELEASHPRLAFLLEQALKLLSDIGI